MATITKISGKWRAQIRKRGHRPISRYFATSSAARAWADEVESAIAAGRSPTSPGALRVADAIRGYFQMRAKAGRPVPPTSNTRYMLEHLLEDLGDSPVEDLTPDRLTDWARSRRDQGAGPYTVSMELSQLGTVLRHVAAFRSLALPDVVGNARPLLHYLQLIGPANRRRRRPTDDEEARVIGWIRQNRAAVVADAIEVAAITAMRRGEVCRILRADVDEKTRSVVIRHRKHPRRQLAHDDRIPLLGNAWEIVKRQPASAEDPRVFSVSPETLSDAVTAATRALGIDDLRLHDFRRGANMRLREMGFDRAARKAVLGHLSDEVHDIYEAVDLTELHRRFDEHAATALQATPQRRQRPRKARARSA